MKPNLQTWHIILIPFDPGKTEDLTELHSTVLEDKDSLQGRGNDRTSEMSLRVLDIMHGPTEDLFSDIRIPAHGPALRPFEGFRTLTYGPAEDPRTSEDQPLTGLVADPVENFRIPTHDHSEDQPLVPTGLAHDQPSPHSTLGQEDQLQYVISPGIARGPVGQQGTPPALGPEAQPAKDRPARAPNIQLQPSTLWDLAHDLAPAREEIPHKSPPKSPAARPKTDLMIRTSQPSEIQDSSGKPHQASQGIPHRPPALIQPPTFKEPPPITKEEHKEKSAASTNLLHFPTAGQPFIAPTATTGRPQLMGRPPPVIQCHQPAIPCPSPSCPSPFISHRPRL